MRVGLWATQVGLVSVLALASGPSLALQQANVKVSFVRKQFQPYTADKYKP
jgi:hypothetical protein